MYALQLLFLIVKDVFRSKGIVIALGIAVIAILAAVVAAIAGGSFFVALKTAFFGLALIVFLGVLSAACFTVFKKPW